MVVEQAEQTFAAFVLDKGSQAKSLLDSIEKIDAVSYTHLTLPTN